MDGFLSHIKNNIKLCVAKSFRCQQQRAQDQHDAAFRLQTERLRRTQVNVEPSDVWLQTLTKGKCTKGIWQEIYLTRLPDQNISNKVTKSCSHSALNSKTLVIKRKKDHNTLMKPSEATNFEKNRRKHKEPAGKTAILIMLSSLDDSPVHTHTTLQPAKIICLLQCVCVCVCVCVCFTEAHGGSRFIEIIFHFSFIQQFRDWKAAEAHPALCVCVCVCVRACVCVERDDSLLWRWSCWLSCQGETERSHQSFSADRSFTFWFVL